MRLILILFLVFNISSVQGQNPRTYVWPNGAKAAVCLTYDDALDGHLNNAIPQLNEAGLNGTFYCTGSSPTLYHRLEEWRAAAEAGHEIGNHTLFHPCVGSGPGREWVPDEYDLNDYTTLKIYQELQTANSLLHAIDGKTERTFAYTCSDYTAGGQSFVDTLKQLFVGARGIGPIPETMEDYNVYMAPSYMVSDPTIEELIAYLEEAKEKGTIVIIMFHGVGDSYLNVDPAVHRQLVTYIAEHSDDYYCATFKEVMKYVSSRAEEEAKRR